ncbi:MAG TPA: ATP-binding protein [Pyrinomonadaceae bacterium]|nr:ATP-binding protein [Pyrinomonadaceae bacterium]
MTSTPYENNWEHLAAEFALLDLLLRREVLGSRLPPTTEQPQFFKGVYLAEAEIEQLLGGQAAPGDDSTTGAQLEELNRAAAALRLEIQERSQATLERGVFLALPHLARLFDLTPFEAGAVAVCLALEADLKYERLYAFLQDDLTRKRPSVDLILRLLTPANAERLRARAFFAPQATLFRSHILRSASGPEAPQLARLVRLDERITNYLLGVGGMEREAGRCVRVAPAPCPLAELRWPDELKERLLGVTAEHLRSPLPARRLIFHFYGPAGTGKKTLAAALCGELGIPLLVVDLRRVLEGSHDFEEGLRAVTREAMLRPAALFLEHFDLLVHEGEKEKSSAHLRAVADAVEDFSWLTFVATPYEWESAGLFGEHVLLGVALPAPDAEERARLWGALADGGASFAPEVEWEDLAGRFRLTPGKLRDAHIAARNYAHLRDGDAAQVRDDDLYRACRAQSNQRLGTLARKLALRHDWHDLILPPDSLAHLRELCAQMRHRQTVFGTWGFERQLSLRRGLCALFCGPSGTGKTMAVEIIARELELDAYKIDLSTVVSKYIGETEKNLSRIFEEAETSNAVLFFDEADALFGKRSEVKDAHDRYANIEINYLLQRIEEFEGLVILATNLRKNIDEAFFRRMSVSVEFPFPEEADRYRIWKRHFPDAAPVADDVDFNFLAGRLHLAGGNIKNIAVGAAFLAAANSGRIHMRHVIRAARREYEKIGRMCTEMEFAPYHVLLDTAGDEQHTEAR